MVGGTLRVYRNPRLPDLHPLEDLERVGSLTIEENAGLVEIATIGLVYLDQIRHLDILDNPGLSQCLAEGQRDALYDAGNFEFDDCEPPTRHEVSRVYGNRTDCGCQAGGSGFTSRPCVPDGECTEDADCHPAFQCRIPNGQPTGSCECGGDTCWCEKGIQQCEPANGYPFATTILVCECINL